MSNITLNVPCELGSIVFVSPIPSLDIRAHTEMKCLSFTITQLYSYVICSDLHTGKLYQLPFSHFGRYVFTSRDDSLKVGDFDESYR